MTDRELLEAAAKAAGHKIHHWSTILPGPMLVDPDTGDCGGFWNPLTEDGDALQLAVKLRLYVRYHEALGQGIASTISGDEYQVNVEDYNHDEDAATRRAIVRAAAAHPGPREGVDT